MKDYYVYILASHKQGTLYVGVTNDLERRIYEHKSEVTKGFTSRYGVKRLVYYEASESIEAAIAREKQLKSWKRKWKVQLIEKQNPEWVDVSTAWDTKALDSGSEPGMTDNDTSVRIEE